MEHRAKSLKLKDHRAERRSEVGGQKTEGRGLKSGNRGHIMGYS